MILLYPGTGQGPSVAGWGRSRGKDPPPFLLYIRGQVKGRILLHISGTGQGKYPATYIRDGSREGSCYILDRSREGSSCIRDGSRALYGQVKRKGVTSLSAISGDRSREGSCYIYPGQVKGRILLYSGQVM